MLSQACLPFAWLLPKGSSMSAAPWWAGRCVLCAGPASTLQAWRMPAQPTLGSSPEPAALRGQASGLGTALSTLPACLRLWGALVPRWWYLPLHCPSWLWGHSHQENTQDGVLSIQRKDEVSMVLWNLSGYSWMHRWHLYRPIEKSWTLSRLGIRQSLQPLGPSHQATFFLFSWRWVRERGRRAGQVRFSPRGWAGMCSCGESFTLLFSGGLCL